MDEYPALIKDAGEEGEGPAEKAFSRSRDVESLHAELYKKAMNDMLTDRQSDYYVCQVCATSAKMRLPETVRYVGQ